MICRHCKTMMRRVYRFENEKSYRLFRCPNCYIETKPIPYSFYSYEISRKNTTVNIKKNTRKNSTKKRG